MTAAGLGQLGGIVGGVGQALSISVPLTESGRAYNEASGRLIELRVARARRGLESVEIASGAGVAGRMGDDVYAIGFS